MNLHVHGQAVETSIGIYQLKRRIFPQDFNPTRLHF